MRLEVLQCHLTKANLGPTQRKHFRIAHKIRRLHFNFSTDFRQSNGSKMCSIELGRTWNVNTLKAMGRDLLDLQWLGRGLHNMQGEPVWTSSPCSPKKSCSKWSGTILTKNSLVYFLQHSHSTNLFALKTDFIVGEKKHTQHSVPVGRESRLRDIFFL